MKALKPLYALGLYDDAGVLAGWREYLTDQPIKFASFENFVKRAGEFCPRKKAGLTRDGAVARVDAIDKGVF